MIIFIVQGSSRIKVNKDALLEYEPLKQNDLFFIIERNAISGDTVTVLVHNVRSFPRHLDDIVSHNRIINDDIIIFTEHKPNNQILLVK